jgi:UDP-3-O-[3-hydroxymyristoyl] N-acetylglucosamine deacetylase
MMKRTLAGDISFSGVGIHTGKKVHVRLRPYDRGEILFRRLDLDGMEMRLDAQSVEAKNSTAILSGEKRIQTIEHLMAVFFGLGIDSALVELDGPEIPALDGSALPFARAVLDCGSEPLSLAKKTLRIQKPFVLREGDASVSFGPGAGLTISYSIIFDHPLIGSQEKTFSLSAEGFVDEIAPARTFGFLKDVDRLREQGMALGGSLDNAVVLDDEGVINGPLRFPDEFVRHKILDFLGDLALLRHSLSGEFRAHKAGHRLHLLTVRHLLTNPDHWTLEA